MSDALPDVLLSFLLEQFAQPAHGSGGPPRVGLACYSFDNAAKWSPSPDHLTDESAIIEDDCVQSDPRFGCL